MGGDEAILWPHLRPLIRRLAVLGAGLLISGAVAAPPLRGRVICLDPGHPSEVGPGTRGKRITEMEACWQIAQKLKALLKAQGARVVLTKMSVNQKVTNRERATVANRAQADLMLRLHADAAPDSGFATFYPSRRGRAHGKDGPSDRVIRQSAEAGRAFHRAAIAVLKGSLDDRGLRTDRQTAIGGRQGALTGSIFSEVPVLLVEMGVLTQPRDDRFLSSKAGQEKMARALLAGVRAALTQRP